MFDWAGPRPVRRVSLTAMIDVVFLLLVFFMLAARFGAERAIPVALAGAAADWEGAPRVVDVAPGGLRLNGVPMPEARLLAELARLGVGPDSAVVLRPVGGATLERLVAAMDRLRAAGHGRLALGADR